MSAQRLQLWVSLVCLSTGALMLHYRIHPPQESLTHFWPTFFSAVDLVGVSILFLFKRTAVWALLLNSFIAYLGIIMMSDLSIDAALRGVIQISPKEQPIVWLLQTTFADSAVLLGDMLVGMALYKVTIARSEGLAQL
ncbi:MAG: hypothetical protein LDL33_15620 [Desulfomonile sp.]|nr:hypothetical protein [Desulfomonile sp.]